MQLPADVAEALDLSGKNRNELRRVLRHYYSQKEDSLKFRAACFLIRNMRWHYSSRHVRESDLRLDAVCDLVDSAYLAIWKEAGGALDSLNSCENLLRSRFKWLADSVRTDTFIAPLVETGMFPDLEVVDSKFLIGHIDNAFRQWHQSPFACYLSFEEFCEDLLPYRSLRGYPVTASGQELAGRYACLVNSDTTETLVQRVHRYNRRNAAARNLLGWKPFREMGRKGCYFRGTDCIDVAVWGADVLRACGIPARVEFCEAYRSFAGRHYYCAVRDTAGKWQGFSPETEVPEAGKWSVASMMNVYRWCYGARDDSPYFLKSEGEYLPPLFASPCIRETTSQWTEVVKIKLPFPVKTANHLAYLAAFQARRDLAPVTWGIIDSLRREVCFEHVMFDRLYFPLYYEGRRLRSFAAPFWVEKDTAVAAGYRLHIFRADTTTETIRLTRKFSRKPGMIKVAEELVGATFIGANRYDFSDARVIYTIRTPPEPVFQDYILSCPVKYKHYRFKAPDAFPHANVGTVEYLTDRAYGDTNVMEPVPLTVLAPEDTMATGHERRWVKLMDAPWEKMKRRPEADGNMQTAPSAYRMVTMRLKQPQTVCRIRFAPKNADNGIHRREHYELFYWDNGWKSCGRQIPRYEYLEYENVPCNALLWLRNYTSGKEEMPFVIRGGRQVFLYPDIIP